MCDPVLIAAILEELGYFDEKKEKDRKEKVRDEGGAQEGLKFFSIFFSKFQYFLCWRKAANDLMRKVGLFQ